jgi:hypothetical protein
MVAGDNILKLIAETDSELRIALKVDLPVIVEAQQGEDLTVHLENQRIFPKRE